MDAMFLIRFLIPSIVILLAFILKLFDKDGWGWFLLVGFILFGWGWGWFLLVGFILFGWGWGSV